MPNKTLFQLGDFKLHAGQKSNFKIDCDFLTDEDLKTLASIAKSLLPKFSIVKGIPEGGLRFAKALQAHTSPVGPLLIADDVYTTGTSFESFRGQINTHNIIGVCIFSRTSHMLPWVQSIFKMEGLNQ